MRILIIGGAGYIGTSLVEELLKFNYEVDVVDLCWFGNYLPTGCKLIKKDAITLTKKDLIGYEQVIFLAGLSNDPMADFSGPHNFVHNCAVPTHIALLAKEAGVKRFIFASSASVYGFTNNEVHDEESKPLTVFPYGMSKLQAERGIFQIVDSDFSVIATRKGTVSGYSRRMRFDLVVNTMFKTAVLNKKITVNNPALQRPILSVKDAVRAYVFILRAPYNISGIFNIISENTNVGELGELVRSIVSRELGFDVQLDVFNKADLRSYQISGAKAEMVFGYTPIFSVKDIVYELVFHRNEFGDFSNENYYNIEVFKKIYESQCNRS
jgi:nucleoside-diphosphate-sugar epimerase